MDTWTIKTQGETTIYADAHGETYTQADIDFMIAFNEEAIKEIAITMGRTYFAITSLRAAIKSGKINSPTRVIAKSDLAYRGWVEGMGDE